MAENQKQVTLRSELLEVLKRRGIIEEKESGQVILHLSGGSIMKITKPDKDVTHG